MNLNKRQFIKNRKIKAKTVGQSAADLFIRTIIRDHFRLFVLVQVCFVRQCPPQATVGRRSQTTLPPRATRHLPPPGDGTLPAISTLHALYTPRHCCRTGWSLSQGVLIALLLNLEVPNYTIRLPGRGLRVTV